MPHGGHVHDHERHDGHTHAHARQQGYSAPGAGHNHAGDGPLHSHVHSPDAAAELQILTAQFIDGFVAAKDKTSYLRLAGVPLERPGPDGGPSLKLVDVQLTTEWQVGTASPSFGSRELSYMPYPGEMVSERTNMALVYVSLTDRQDIDIRSFVERSVTR